MAFSYGYLISRSCRIDGCLCCWLQESLPRRLLTRCLLVLILFVLIAGSLLALWATAKQLYWALHVYHDFGGVTLNFVLFPLAGLHSAFDLALRTFAQVLPGYFYDLAETATHGANRYALLSGLTAIGPLLASGQAQIGHSG